ncbi:MAG: META domain-containing protein [Pseudoflavonifractor sp.]|nr:META domain-containing protein [Pseudoflavonifractor sp.]
MRTSFRILTLAALLSLAASCSILKKSDAKDKAAENTESRLTPAVSDDRYMKLSKRLLDGEWTIAEVNDRKVTGEERPYITFSTADNRVYGSNGCNIINGSFAVEGEKGLRFGDIITGMRACADAPFEYEINDGLAHIDSYAVEKRGHEYYLNLYDKSRRKVMTLRKHNMDYLNGAWRVGAINGKAVRSDEVQFVIDIPELKLHGNTGCNVLNGSIYIDPDKTNSIQFQDIATTRMRGSDVEMDVERELLIALEEVESARKTSRGVTMYDNHGHEVLSLHKIDDK